MTPVERFDAWADERLEALRGNPVADEVFTAASTLGDFSVMWHLIVAARGLTSDERADQAFVLAALLGAESLLVNQGLKRMVHRPRPTQEGDPRFAVRRPSTSSFPSGHASAAFFAATMLTGWGGRRTAPVWFGLAGIVATSRAYVRLHHASDVVAGAVLGVALAGVARRAVRRIQRAR